VIDMISKIKRFFGLDVRLVKYLDDSGEWRTKCDIFPSKYAGSILCRECGNFKSIDNTNNLVSCCPASMFARIRKTRPFQSLVRICNLMSFGFLLGLSGGAGYWVMEYFWWTVSQAIQIGCTGVAG